MSTRDYGIPETEYITGEASLADLAQKHEIPVGTLARICADRDWLGKREAYRAEMKQKTDALARERDINVRREVLDSFLEARKAWAQSKRQADDYATLARLAAAMVGEATERADNVQRVVDLRELPEHERNLIEDHARQVADALSGATPELPSGDESEAA